MRQILFIWYSKEKLLSIYIPNNSSIADFNNCCFQLLNLWYLLQQFDKEKQKSDIWKHLLSSCWNWILQTFFSVVISRLFMTSFSLYFARVSQTLTKHTTTNIQEPSTGIILIMVLRILKKPQLCNAQNSGSSLSTLVFQDLLLIWAVPMSSQRAKQLLSTDRSYIYMYIYIYIYIYIYYICNT